MNQMIKVFFMSSAVMMAVGSIEAMNNIKRYTDGMKNVYDLNKYSNMTAKHTYNGVEVIAFKNTGITQQEVNDGITCRGTYGHADLGLISNPDGSQSLLCADTVIKKRFMRKNLQGWRLYLVPQKNWNSINEHRDEVASIVAENTSTTENDLNNMEEVSVNAVENVSPTNEIVAESNENTETIDGTQTNETVAAEVGENTETPTNEVVAESNDNTPPVDNIQTNVEDNENEVSINIQINEATENSDDDSSLEPLEISSTSAPQIFRGTPILSRLLGDYTDDVERNTCCAGLWETIRNLFTRR